MRPFLAGVFLRNTRPAINFKVMYGSNVPEKYRPGLVLALISWLGIAFFVAMSSGFIYVQFLRG